MSNFAKAARRTGSHARRRAVRSRFLLPLVALMCSGVSATVGLAEDDTSVVILDGATITPQLHVAELANIYTGLIRDAPAGDAVELKKKVEEAGLNHRDVDGKTLLMLAAENGHAAAVKALVELGATLDGEITLTSSEHFGETALMLAVCAGHVDTVRALIDAGADVNFISQGSRLGYGALMEAALPIALFALHGREYLPGLLHAAERDSALTLESKSVPGVLIATGGEIDSILILGLLHAAGAKLRPWQREELLHLGTAGAWWVSEALTYDAPCGPLSLVPGRVETRPLSERLYCMRQEGTWLWTLMWISLVIFSGNFLAAAAWWHADRMSRPPAGAHQQPRPTRPRHGERERRHRRGRDGAAGTRAVSAAAGEGTMLAQGHAVPREPIMEPITVSGPARRRIRAVRGDAISAAVTPAEPAADITSKRPQPLPFCDPVADPLMHPEVAAHVEGEAALLVDQNFEEASDGQPDDDKLCAVCLDAERTHALVPCGHRCVCLRCSELAVEQGICPLCRALCAMAMRVYD